MPPSLLLPVSMHQHDVVRFIPFCLHLAALTHAAFAVTPSEHTST